MSIKTRPHKGQYKCGLNEQMVFIYKIYIYLCIWCQGYQRPLKSNLDPKYVLRQKSNPRIAPDGDSTTGVTSREIKHVLFKMYLFCYFPMTIKIIQCEWPFLFGVLSPLELHPTLKFLEIKDLRKLKNKWILKIFIHI